MEIINTLIDHQPPKMGDGKPNTGIRRIIDGPDHINGGTEHLRIPCYNY